MRRSRAAAAVLAVVAVTAACTDDGSGAVEGAFRGTTGEVTVLAASSLTDVFVDVVAAFEDANPAVEVQLSFDASSALAAQITEGVPADVFASADQANLAKVADAGFATGEPMTFATNRLVIVVESGNPLDISGLGDLASGLRLALCASEVPCGRYSAEAFRLAGADVPPASEEENVRGVLMKVELGEADAGLVYATDVRAGQGVDAVELLPDHQVLVEHPATVLRDASNRVAAEAFLAFLSDDVARDILLAHGFESP